MAFDEGHIEEHIGQGPEWVRVIACATEEMADERVNQLEQDPRVSAVRKRKETKVGSSGGGTWFVEVIKKYA